MNDTTTTAVPAGRISAVVEIALIWVVFVLQGGWPTPDTNEAHYVSKAKHYWDPQWISGDFFLDSADSHLLFYVALGWLTKFMSLSAAAWCGRLFTWGLMAWGWRRLSFALLPRAGWSVLTAALFVTLSTRMHMAGEWVVGGFEAKGIAYALVFFAIAELVYDRWNRALLFLGGAAAFHVIVGGWAVVATGICWLLTPRHRPAIRSLVPGLAGCFLLALFGLWPGWELTRGVDAYTIDQANQIYVFKRLPHHLSFNDFKLLFKERFALMFCIWVMLCAFTPTNDAQRRLRRFVVGSLVIALGGLLINLATTNQPVLAASLLRFYWYRLADSMLPLGVSILAGFFITTTWPTHAWRNQAVLAIVLLVTGVHLGSMLLSRVSPPAARSDSLGNKVVNANDWREACEWIAKNPDIPKDAKFLTPRLAQSFKWRTGHSEVATWKDFPQNATDIVEWWQRMQDLYATNKTGPEDDEWYPTLSEQGSTGVSDLARKYGATYVLAEAAPQLSRLKRLYRNNSYAVYAVDK